MAIVSVTIAGNAAPLRNELNKADGLMNRFGGSMKAVAAVGTAAFAALGAGLAIATKAAAEDEQAFEQLRQAIKNTTGASDAMIRSIDEQILKMAIATGVADDQLRPAFGNLIRATGDAAKAQELLSTALDISTATGKPLEAVSIALSKAANGQVTALTRLGIPLDENAVKSKDFAAILGQLNETFGGAAAANADTFAGKMARLQVVFGEIVETIGAALLPIISNLATFVLDKVIPAFDYVSSVVGPKLSEVFEFYADVIQKRVLPAIRDFLVPAIERMAGIFLEYVVPAIKTIAVPIFQGLADIFDKVAQKVRENRETFVRLGDMLENVWGFVRDKLAPVLAIVLRGAFKVAGAAIGPFLDAVFKIIDVFTTVYNFVTKIAGKIVDVIVGLVNGVIDAVNVMIDGFNSLPAALRFGQTITPLGNISISTSSTGAPTVSGGSTPQYVDFRGSMPTFTAPTFGGGGGGETTGGGGGGGGGSKAAGGAGGPMILGPSPMESFTAESFMRAHEQMFGVMEIEVNVNGALATKAEIADGVYQALRVAQDLNGPLQLSIA